MIYYTTTTTVVNTALCVTLNVNIIFIQVYYNIHSTCSLVSV